MPPTTATVPDSESIADLRRRVEDLEARVATLAAGQVPGYAHLRRLPDLDDTFTEN